MTIFANQVTPEVPGRQEFGEHYSSQCTHALWQCPYSVGSTTENPGGKGGVTYNKREHYEENKEETRVLFLFPFSLLLLLLLLHLFSPGQLLLGCGLSAPNRESGTAFHGPPLCTSRHRAGSISGDEGTLCWEWNMRGRGKTCQV